MDPSFPLNEETSSLEDYFDETRGTNLRSSDSGISSISEFSSCGSSEDIDVPRRTENFSPPFLKNLFPWTKSSRVSPRDIDKIGGTLALIQQERPPDLPVKNPLEDKNHKKQYRAILEEARKRELRDESSRRRRLEEQRRREEKLSIDSVIWYTKILPNFESLKSTKKVQDLWWRGLPPSIRGKIWILGISNDLNIKEEQYDCYLKRIRANPANESLTAIRLDVARTFPNLSVFQSGGPLFDDLRSVLAVYTVYRSDIGYVQGMSFVGAMLILNMKPNDAFVCFANLIDNPCHRAAFSLNQKQMNVYYKVFSSALAHKIPKVHSHFSTTGLSPDLYLLDWLYTIYAKAMPLDVACRVWDVFIRDGDEFLFRTALGILLMYQDELLTMDFVRCAQFLTKLPENIQASVLFDNIGRVTSNVGVYTFHDMISQFS